MILIQILELIMSEVVNSDLSCLAQDVSLLMAVYKRDDVRLFDNALHSIFANTVLPAKIVIVADGELTQELEQVLSDYKTRYPSFLRLIRLSHNVGLAKALNEGLKDISTKWVMRADSDDYNLSDRFERQFRFVASHPEIVLFGGAIKEVDFDGSYICTKSVPISHDDIINYIRRRNPFNHMTVMYQADAIRKLGGYPNVYLKEDYALWCNVLGAKLPVANMADVLVNATTGHAMYKRRGGYKYAKSEISLQAILVKAGLKKSPQAFLDGLSRALVYLMPSFIRGYIYRKLLRSA